MREDWRRLADYVINGRVRQGFANRRAFIAHLEELGLSVAERTLGTLERGERVSMDTVASVEIGLNWEPGSGRTTLYGGEPTWAPQVSDSALAQDGIAVERRAEIPPYIDLDQAEDWEREIWEKLTLTSAEDKSLMIEYLKFMRDRASRAEGAGQGAQRRTG